jgi:uncharacterized protein YggE
MNKKPNRAKPEGNEEGRAGELSPARPVSVWKRDLREETKVATTYESRVRTKPEGVTVIGEAVRRAAPENAEFVIEITAAGASAAVALHQNQAKTAQLTQAIGALGIQQADLQPISMNVYSVYTPALPALQAFGGMTQAVAPFSYAGGAVLQPEVQSAMFQARSAWRVNVRDTRRLGDILDSVVRSGATVTGPLSVRSADEPAARKAALEAAGRDARAKAETLAAAVGKQVGDAVDVAEEIVAADGVYAAWRAATPFAFGSGTPLVAGDLEYYARVQATFRLQ